MQSTRFAMRNASMIMGIVITFSMSAVSAEFLKLQGGAEPVRVAIFSPDGTTIFTASAFEKTFRIWDAHSGKELQQFAGCYVLSAVFSPDGKKIIVMANDGTVRIFDVQSGTLSQTLERCASTSRLTVFTSDGKRIVTADSDHIARIWDAYSGEELQKLEGHSQSINTATFSPDGTKVVTSSDDRTARIWDANSGKELHKLTGHKGWIRTAIFSPDGTKIVTASTDRTARIWDADAGIELKQMKEFGFVIPISATYSQDIGTLGILSAVFSPDGKMIVTTTTNRAAHIWDVESGKKLQTLKRHTGWVRSAAFSPDGKKIVTTDDKTARIWFLK